MCIRDRIRTLTLAVNPLLTKSYNITVCANELPYTWLGHVFTQANTITDTAAGNNSCDTIRTLTLAVNPLLTKSYNCPLYTSPSPRARQKHRMTPSAWKTNTAAG